MQDTHTLCCEAVNVYGATTQIGMFVEEIGEVLQAINKLSRKTDEERYDNLIEELVDLQIMLIQMRIVYHIPDQLWDEMMEKKLQRLRHRLDDYES